MDSPGRRRRRADRRRRDPAFAQNFDDPKDFEDAKELLKMKPQGPEGKPWEQNLGGKEVDTSKYKKAGPYRICFSNAGVDNPWRVVGWTQHAGAGRRRESRHQVVHRRRTRRARTTSRFPTSTPSSQAVECDILIVSPNTTAALTPAVEAACKKLPVVVFDRGVLTQCPVTFVNPIGGYGWGIQTANFIADKLPKGGKVLALRILPGVDVLETRWSAANRIFKEKGVNVVGAEFTDGDNAKTKRSSRTISSNYGKIDAIWMDAGATAVAAIEAFEDAGQPYPIITGEDQEDFLVEVAEGEARPRCAPTYPTYQWRSAVIAALKILKGEPVIGPTWKLPQPDITAGDARPVRRPKDAAAALCDVRLQGSARLSPALGRQVTRRGPRSPPLVGRRGAARERGGGALEGLAAKRRMRRR